MSTKKNNTNDNRTRPLAEFSARKGGGTKPVGKPVTIANPPSGEVVTPLTLIEKLGKNLRDALVEQHKHVTFYVRIDASHDEFNEIAAYAAKMGAPFSQFAQPNDEAQARRINGWFADNI